MMIFLMDFIMLLWVPIHHQRRNSKLKELKIQKVNILTGRSYESTKINRLIRFIGKKVNSKFTGELIINFHEGNFSTRLSVKETKDI